MLNPVEALHILLARATERELAQQLQYVQTENRILRARLPKPVMTTPAERTRLLKYGRPVGDAINQLITIVVPGTIHRWGREAKGQKRSPARTTARPKKPLDIKHILKIAHDTGWGYTRVLGEIRKLTRHRISRHAAGPDGPLSRAGDVSDALPAQSQVSRQPAAPPVRRIPPLRNFLADSI